MSVKNSAAEFPIVDKWDLNRNTLTINQINDKKPRKSVRQ